MVQKYSDEEVAFFLNTASYLDPRFKKLVRTLSN